jgi:hypothetical protein
MKDVQATLRRIDEEITASRQEIARQQINIVRLEDTRRVLMGLAEADQEAAAHRVADRGNVLPGSHARPVLIVRKIGSGDASEMVDGAHSDAPLGIVASGKRKGQPRVRKSRSGATELRERVLRVVEPGGKPISPKEIGNNIGLPAREEVRKPLWNQLYQMRVKGLIERDEVGRYYRPAEARQQAAG